MAPTGPVQTPAPSGRPFGIAWEEITRYDAFVHEAADPVGWPIARIRAHIVIESQGNPDAVQRNPHNGDSIGLMQIVPFGVGWEGWHRLVRNVAGLSERAPAQKVRQALTDPRTNIHAGVAILESLFQEHGTLDRASSAFFTGRHDWSGRDTENGATGRQYRDCLHGLIAEQGEAPAPLPRQDPLDIIFGGNPAPVTFGFRELNSAPLYHYGVGHGTTSPSAHSGIDVGVPYQTPLHTPAAGRVLCVGERGRNLWGQGCGTFHDTGDDGPGGARLGAGNITILLDSGHKLTLGHCRQALVAPGERVAAGQQVGTSGGMFGAHTHIDVAVERPDLVTAGDGLSYWLLDPLPALRQAMGEDAAPVFIPAPRLPVPQPQEWDDFVTVTAIRDGVPVLQRAAPDAPAVRQPLTEGETFAAVMLVLGTDQRWYWVSRRGARIPVDGTTAEAGPHVSAA